MNKKQLLFGLLWIVLLKQIYLWLIGKGVGVHFNKHHPGKCRIVPGIQCGSEKISVATNGLAFITNGLSMYTNCNKQYLKGKLYLFDFNHPENNVVQLQITGSTLDLESFTPHGMDILEELEMGLLNIYVINHANRNETIEVFKYELIRPNEVRHVATIRDEKFVCLNDLTLINENVFYITNFAKYCHSSVQALLLAELAFGLSTGNIVYYNQGKSWHVGFGPSLNGITQSVDNKNILVTSTSTGTLRVYEHANNGMLQLEKTLLIGYSPDNVYTDMQTGDVYIGVEKTSINQLLLSENKTHYSSASAVKITPSGNWRNAKVTEILYDDGKEFIHGVSSAVHYRSAYLIGTVFHKLAYCKQ